MSEENNWNYGNDEPNVNQGKSCQPGEKYD